MTEKIFWVTEKIFIMIEKIFLAAEKIFSVVETMVSAMEKIFSVAEKIFFALDTIFFTTKTICSKITMMYVTHSKWVGASAPTFGLKPKPTWITATGDNKKHFHASPGAPRRMRDYFRNCGT
jgi:hypothetical protein